MALKRDEIADPTSCLNRAADDEPVFVLRAKDPLAAKMVEDWAARALLAGLHEDKVQAAYRYARSMRAWRKKNFPDGPAEPEIKMPFPNIEEKKP
jgi:hypothetical protein